MDRLSALKADFTCNQAMVGLSLKRPVRVFSVHDASTPSKPEQAPPPASEEDIIYLRPGDPGHPGAEYGVVVEADGYRVTRPHDHDYFEISIIRGGSAIHCTEEGRKPLLPGMTTVLQPGLVHGFENPHNFKQTNIYYLAEWLLEDVAEYWEEEGLVPLFFAGVLFRHHSRGEVPHFELSPPEQEAACRDLAAISNELEQDRPSLVMLKACFLRFLIILSRSYCRQARGYAELPFRREVWAAMHLVEEIIRRRGTFHVQEAAREVGLSTSHFSAIFRKETGWAPMDYYQRRRIQHASRLLMNTALSTAEVAYALGFCHSAYFSNLFKRFQGMSPSAFRDLYLHGLKHDS